MGRQEGRSLVSLDALLREGGAVVRGCGCLELWGCRRLRTLVRRTPLGLSATADALAAIHSLFSVSLSNFRCNSEVDLGLRRLRLRLAGALPIAFVAFPMTFVVCLEFFIGLSCDLEPKMLQTKSL